MDLECETVSPPRHGVVPPRSTAQPSPAGTDDLEHQVQTLREALGTSRSIGAAIGILMVERRLTEQGAFAVLVERSSHTNRKLRDIAAEIVAAADRRASEPSATGQRTAGKTVDARVTVPQDRRG